MHTRSTVSVLIVLAACGTTAKQAPVQSPPLAPTEQLSFAGLSSDWVAEPTTSRVTLEPNAQPDATVTISPADDGEESHLTRIVDATPLRGRKVRVVARAVPHASTASAELQLSLIRPGHRADAWDTAATTTPAGSMAPRQLVAVIDVSDDAVAIRVRLGASGKASTTFGPPSMGSLPSVALSPRALSSDEKGRLLALARLVGYLRFFHPSDESAAADWDALEVESVRRVLDARSDEDARAVLQWLTSVVAPTAELYAQGQVPHTATIPQTSHGWFTRWHRIGLGSNPPYVAIRDGIDEPADLGVEFYKFVMLRDVGRCKHVLLRASDHVVSGDPRVTISLATVRGRDNIDSKTSALDKNSQLEQDVSDLATGVVLGLNVSGHGEIDVHDLSLACDGREVFSSASSELATRGHGAALFKVVPKTPCDSGECIRVSRLLSTTFDPKSDILDEDIGLGMRIRMPLAVWTDGAATVPPATVMAPDVNWSARDLPARVAAAMDVWVHAHWFYAYFTDLKINWDDLFAPAVDAAARASSSTGLYDALSHLLVGLRDSHAGVVRPDYDTGVLPFFFHKDGDELYVAAIVDPYEDLLPLGTVVETIDGVPTATVLHDTAARVSAGTPGYRDYFSTILLGYGPEGELVQLQVRKPDGTETMVTVPRVASSKFGLLREKHQENGTELAPGISYVDLSTIELAKWDELAPHLVASKVIIFDMRGYVASGTFDALGHLTDTELWSPFWDSPIVEATGSNSYVRSQWPILPRGPRLKARIIFLVDGRTVSAAETTMQIVHQNRLGLVVGEPTAGTNGNMVIFRTVGNWLVSFTGMHVLNRDGTLHQGHGIQPDIVVHPTRQGLISGHDEVLDAAVRAAAQN